MASLALPVCPRPGHRGWMVVRDGYYGRPPRRRQRFRCVAPDGTFHRFVPAVPRVLSTGPCPVCELTPAHYNGRTTPRSYRYTSHEIGAALTALALGATYQNATETVRASAALRGVPGTRHGQLVADWVEVFADAVCAPEAETTWPPFVMLDTTPFWRRTQGKVRPQFHIYAAYGYDRLGDRGRVLLLRVYQELSQENWEDFMGQLDGRPRYTISDRGKDLVAALNTHWPSVRPIWCHHHLTKSLERAVATDARAGRTTPDAVLAALPAALTSWESWNAFATLANDQVPAHHSLFGTAGAIDLFAKRQFRLRHYHVPLGNGPIERVLTTLRRQLAGRAQGLANLRRTNLLLDLLRLGYNSRADAEVFTERVRQEIERRHGTVAPVRQIAFHQGQPDF